jgi:hypothetical protein
MHREVKMLGRAIRLFYEEIGPIPLLIIAAAVIAIIFFIRFSRYIGEKRLERDVKKLESEILGDKTKG